MAAPAPHSSGRVGPAQQNMPVPSAPAAPKTGALNSSTVKPNPANVGAAAAVAYNHIAQGQGSGAAKVVKPNVSAGDAKTAPGAAGVAHVAAGKIGENKGAPAPLTSANQLHALADKMKSNISRNAVLVGEAVKTALLLETERLQAEFAKHGKYLGDVEQRAAIDSVTNKVLHTYAVDVKKLVREADVILSQGLTGVEQIYLQQVLPEAVKEIRADKTTTLLLSTAVAAIPGAESKIIRAEVIKVNRARPLHK